MIEFPTSKVTDLDGHDGRLHSVVRGRNDYDVPAPPAIDSDEFGREVELFLSARHDVKAGRWPYEYFEAIGLDPAVPDMFRPLGVTEDDPVSAARLVDHAMDKTIDLHHAFVDHFKGAKLKKPQAERSPQSAGVDFLGWREFDAIVLENVHKALIEAFQVKYFYAFPRPEHHFAAGALIGEYGCPPHPSYVAGHGAIAGTTVQTWIDHVKLTDAQITQAEHAGRHYAHYRTLAGVHWAMDNTQGYELGRQVSAL